MLNYFVNIFKRVVLEWELLSEFYFKILVFFLMEKNLSVKGSWINPSDGSSVFILSKGVKL